jgi:tRNA A-37 threonylcarbamoyl transferase component Bud32
MPSNRPKSSAADAAEVESSQEASCVEGGAIAGRALSAACPARLGRYRIICELASGGMASVNLAIADGLDKLLALKIIHPHLVKERAFLGMFLDEARIASGVLHRNVCNVFDHGEHNGSYYIAMDYHAGRTLREVIRRLRNTSQMPTEAAHQFMMYVIAEACEGLHAAHELRGTDGELLDVVHRDVTPQNLLITYDGHVSVIDFGIAYAANRLQHTATGVLKGKFSYMAPEQLRAGPIDRRTDIWALGICLWEGLTRRRLFAGATQADTLMNVLNAEIVPPSQIDPTLPAALDPIVLRALSRLPDERYASARELGLELTRVYRESGLSVGPLEIEQFMAALFSEEIERAAQLEQQAKQLAAQERAASFSACAPVHADAAALQAPHWPCESTDLVAAVGAVDTVAGAPASSARETLEPATRTGGGMATWRRATLWAGFAVAVLCVLQWHQGQGARDTQGRRATVSIGGAASSARGQPSQGPARGAVAQSTEPAGAQQRAQAGAPHRAKSKASSKSAPGAGQGAALTVQADGAPEQASALERARLPLTAQVSFTGVRTAGPLVPSVVSRMLSRAGPMVRECYLDAAGRAGSELPSSVPMWFSIDESGAVRDGSLGAQARPALAACVLQALRRVRTDQAPEAGIVNVAVELTFRATL